MHDKNAAIERITALIERGIPFSPARKRGSALTHAEVGAASAWIARVTHVVASIDPAIGRRYRPKCRDLSARFADPLMDGGRPNAIRSECVGELVAILKDLLADIKTSRTAASTGRTRAEPVAANRVSVSGSP